MTRVFVRPLRPGVPAENGAKTMLGEHGAIRDMGPYWDRMRQIGAVQVRELPARGQLCMVRPVDGARVLSTGHRHGGDAPRGAEPLGDKGAEVRWGEAHEGALADRLIRFPEPTKAELTAIESAAVREFRLAAEEYDLTEKTEGGNV